MQVNWCYPIERCLKTLRKKCRNKAKIEASIAEAYILEEVSNFTKNENLPSMHNLPLVIMLAKMNRTSAFSKGNSEAQVHRPLSTWVLKSGAVSCYMCWPTLSRCSRMWGKFSTNLFQYAVTILHPTPLFLVGTGNFFMNPGINQGILPRRKMIPFFHRVRDQGGSVSFLGSKIWYRPI